MIVLKNRCKDILKVKNNSNAFQNNVWVNALQFQNIVVHFKKLKRNLKKQPLKMTLSRSHVPSVKPTKTKIRDFMVCLSAKDAQMISMLPAKFINNTMRVTQKFLMSKFKKRN